MKAAYLDASALVKLFKHEAETDALWAALSEWPDRVSSELLAVEARCTARRLGGAELLERAEARLTGVDLLPYTSEIGERAGGAFRPALRALDAIHLASALALDDSLGVLLAYDEDLCAAARSEGLPVRSPK